MFEAILYVTMTVEVNLWALVLTACGVVVVFILLLKEISGYKSALHQWSLEAEIEEP